MEGCMSFPPLPSLCSPTTQFSKINSGCLGDTPEQVSQGFGGWQWEEGNSQNWLPALRMSRSTFHLHKCSRIPPKNFNNILYHINKTVTLIILKATRGVYRLIPGTLIVSPGNGKWRTSFLTGGDAIEITRINIMNGLEQIFIKGIWNYWFFKTFYIL